MVLIRQSTNPVTLIANDRYRVDQPLDLKGAYDCFGSKTDGQLCAISERYTPQRLFWKRRLRWAAPPC
jgi:hypothetical protein